MNDLFYIIIGLILLVCFTGFYIVTFKSSKFITAGTTLMNVCGNGYCVTNILTGEKNCPIPGGGELAYDVTKEVCNLKYQCDNVSTPYPLLEDFSTGSKHGVCPRNVECRCMRKKSCPKGYTSFFRGGKSISIENTMSEQFDTCGVPYSTLFPGEKNFSKIKEINPCEIGYPAINNFKQVVCIGQNLCKDSASLIQQVNEGGFVNCVTSELR